MASNVTSQSHRNVLSEKFMVKREGSVDNINLFSVITIMSFSLLLPVTYFVEGTKSTPQALAAAGVDVKVVDRRQVSYIILAKVSPVMAFRWELCEESACDCDCDCQLCFLLRDSGYHAISLYFNLKRFGIFIHHLERNLIGMPL